MYKIGDIILANDCKHCDDGKPYDENGDIMTEQICGECEGKGMILTDAGKSMIKFMEYMGKKEPE